MDKTSEIAALLMAGRQVDQFGLKPFDPSVNVPKDVGLGGPSTEYTATDYDPNGVPFNYPQIWWDRDGTPYLIQGDQGYNQAVAYEATSGMRFPRYNSIANADFASQNRSAIGGAEKTPLGSLFGTKNW